MDSAPATPAPMSATSTPAPLSGPAADVCTPRRACKYTHVVGDEANWHSGLKTIPTLRRSRSTSRWEAESRKVLPDNRCRSAGAASRARSPSPSDDPWRTGVKTLPKGPLTGDVTRFNTFSDEWHDINKTLDTAPRRQLDLAGWASENGKVLRVRRPRADNRSPPARCPYPNEEPFPEGNWNEENLKILQGTDRSTHLHRSYASQSRTGIARFHREDAWSSGLKTIPVKHVELKPPTWLADNGKTLERAHRQLSITNTGWDSGLKTIRNSERSFPTPTIWSMDKSLPDRRRTPRVTERQSTGWDSGLKTLPPSEALRSRSPATSLRVREDRPVSPDSQRWSTENGKTLPKYYMTAVAHHQEYKRFLNEPLRRDAEHYSERLSFVH